MNVSASVIVIVIALCCPRLCLPRHRLHHRLPRCHNLRSSSSSSNCPLHRDLGLHLCLCQDWDKDKDKDLRYRRPTRTYPIGSRYLLHACRRPRKARDQRGRRSHLRACPLSLVKVHKRRGAA